MTHPDLDITIDGVHFRLRQPLTYTNLATLAPKIVVGDYTQDNNELLSTWVMNDYTGGHGVADLMPADSNRYRWSRGIYTRYPNQWSLPYRLFETEPNHDGVYQPLCDALLADGNDDIDWRHVAANGRRVYVDNVEQTTVKPAGSPPDEVNLSSIATNKGVVFRGNGSDTLTYIPRGSQGYSLYQHSGKRLWNFTEPKFVGFCSYDNKVIGVDSDGQLWQAIRANDKFGADINSSVTSISISAADRKYSVGSVIQIKNEQMKVTAVSKTAITVTRGFNGTTAASHTASTASVENDLVYGQWYKYGGKSKLQSGYDVRDVIVYNDQNGQPAVHIITDRDVWAFDESGPVLFRTSLTFPQKPYSGIGSVVWRGDLYVSGGMDIYRYNGSVVTNVGLSRDDGLPRDYRGAVYDLTAGPNGVYALVGGRVDNSAKKTYWSVHEFSGAGWHTIWADSISWPERTLNGNINDSTRTITLGSNTRIERGDILRIGSEDMRVNARGTSGAVTVRRGVNGTNAAAHDNGDTVYIKSKPTFIHLSQAFHDEQRLFWGVGFKQFYQRLPSEALNPREDVETNTDSYGFGFDGRSGSTYELLTGRFDGQMPGYVKIANGLEMRLRRLPATQVLRVYYRVDERPTYDNWTTLGVVAGGDVTTLNGAIDNSTTSVTLTSALYCKKGMYLRVGSEVMTVTAVTNNTVTVTRGGSPTSHSNGATVLIDFRIGTTTTGRQIWRFGSYADNNNVFKGVPFHSIEFKVVVTDQQGNVIVTSALPSDLIDGVAIGTKEPEDDDQFLGNLTNTASPSKDTFIIEHMSLSFLKVRSASGSWIADIDLSEPWMDKSPQELIDKLDNLLQAQRFFSFRHRDKTYRVRLAQVTGSDYPGFDERGSRRVNIVEIPITLGPLGNW